MSRYVEWDPKKSQKLKEERGIDFDDIMSALQNGAWARIVQHHGKAKFSHQKLLLVDISGYLYVVPFVENEEKMFFKTIFPSRKATKQYLKKQS